LSNSSSPTRGGSSAILGVFGCNLPQPHISNLTDSATHTVRGLVLVQAPPFTDFRYGDQVRAQGTRSVQSSANMGDLDYREYLSRQVFKGRQETGRTAIWQNQTDVSLFQ